MKKELAVASMILFLLFAPLTKAAFAAETKKVCTKQVDAKTKKEKEVCKVIKVHKMLENATVVPEKGKKK
jgi:hypothetical protein